MSKVTPDTTVSAVIQATTLMGVNVRPLPHTASYFYKKFYAFYARNFSRDVRPESAPKKPKA